MKIEKNIDLKKYTTFQMGGIAKVMYIPESEAELLDCMRREKRHTVRWWL